MSFAIDGIYRDYNRNKIIVSISSEYTGDTSIPISISGVVSEEVVYNYLNAGKKTTTDPYFNAAKPGVTILNANQEVI